MTRWRGGVPPFLMGLALAMIGEVATGLLLYGGPGFLPALSVILATMLTSLALGILADDGARGSAAIERTRNLWLHALISFAVAGAFAMGWEVFQGFGARAVTQAAGLAVLAALPFYFGGRVLGRLAALPGTRGRGRTVAAALFGGAAGVVVVGYLLFPAVSPTGVLLLSLVTVSGGALVHGWALDEVFWIDRSARHVGPAGVFEIERWMRGNPRSQRLAVRENGRLRTLLEPDGMPVSPEERAILELARSVEGPGGRVLSVGVGATLLADSLGWGGDMHHVIASDPPSVRWVLDEVGDFIGETGAGARARPVGERMIHRADPGRLLHLDGVVEAAGTLDAILVDTLAVAATPAGAHLDTELLGRLARRLRPGGILVVYPLLELQGGADLSRILLEPMEGFVGCALFVAPKGDSEPVGWLGESGFPRFPIPPGARRAFLVARAAGAEGGPAAAGAAAEAAEIEARPESGIHWPEPDTDADWPETAGGFLCVPRIGSPVATPSGKPSGAASETPSGGASETPSGGAPETPSESQ